MSQQPHISVMADQVVEYLAPRAGAIVCDGTLGAGGHAERVLEASGDVRLIGLDRDPVALELARKRLAKFGDRATLVHATFAEVGDVLDQLGIDKVDGFVLDLGVSSMQLDEGSRGFSFARSGPIDMRMDQSSGQSALDLLRQVAVTDLSDILRDLGEERYHKRIAARLKQAVRDDELTDTDTLAKVVAECIPAQVKRKSKIHPATLTFQALRIAVNGELDQLVAFLDQFSDLLTIGGRCVIISFHSLEDRLVKHRFRDLAWSSSLPPDLAERAGERVHPICKVLTKRAVVASEHERGVNPRARSAKLRACERLPS